MARSKANHPAYSKTVQVIADDSRTEALTQLADLVKRGELAEASERVRDMERRWPNDDEVQRFVRVLAPPAISVRKGSTGRSYHREYNWLREHSREYPGCWLAVLDHRLIAVSPDAKAVVEAVKRDPSAQGALLHFEPEVPTWR